MGTAQTETTKEVINELKKRCQFIGFKCKNNREEQDAVFNVHFSNSPHSTGKY